MNSTHPDMVDADRRLTTVQAERIWEQSDATCLSLLSIGGLLAADLVARRWQKLLQDYRDYPGFRAPLAMIERAMMTAMLYQDVLKLLEVAGRHFEGQPGISDCPVRGHRSDSLD